MPSPIVTPVGKAKSMGGPRKRVECDCGWRFESADEDALVQAVQEHAEKVHGITGLTRDQALAQAKPV
jgi:predicted small metal-binding protein